MELQTGVSEKVSTGLKNQIVEHMKLAMRAKEEVRLSTIRMLLAAIKQKEVDERIELDDAMILSIIEKLIKQRRESVAQFQNAGREDLVAREQAELEVLLAYMPEPLSADEIKTIIAQAMGQAEAKSLADMGKVMALIKPALSGKADMAVVSALLKEKLSAG